MRHAVDSFEVVLLLEQLNEVKIVKNKSIMGMIILLIVLVLSVTLSTVGVQPENMYRVPVEKVDIETNSLKIVGSVTNFDTVTFSHD